MVSLVEIFCKVSKAVNARRVLSVDNYVNQSLILVKDDRITEERSTSLTLRTAKSTSSMDALANFAENSLKSESTVSQFCSVSFSPNAMVILVEMLSRLI